jgi:NADH-quinone oxidoreductase subunit C
MTNALHTNPESGAPAPTTKPAPTAAAAAAPVCNVPPPAVQPAQALPNPLAHVSIPFQGVDFALRGYHAEASISPEQVAAAAIALDQEGFALDTITGVDWLTAGEVEVVYDYFHPDKSLRAVVRTRVPRDNPEVPTISGIFPGANWHERETHDFFGLRFSGHPDLTPFLLPEDATYHPLRKDFTACS